MTEPLMVDPSDLALYIQATQINEDRAQLALDLALDLASTVGSPLPAAAKGTVLDIASRVYANSTNARTLNLGTASVGYGSTNNTSSTGGLYMTPENRRNLRALFGKGTAMSMRYA